MLILSKKSRSNNIVKIIPLLFSTLKKNIEDISNCSFSWPVMLNCQAHHLGINFTFKVKYSPFSRTTLKAAGAIRQLHGE